MNTLFDLVHFKTLFGIINSKSASNLQSGLYNITRIRGRIVSYILPSCTISYDLDDVTNQTSWRAYIIILLSLRPDCWLCHNNNRELKGEFTLLVRTVDKGSENLRKTASVLSILFCFVIFYLFHDLWGLQQSSFRFTFKGQRLVICQNIYILYIHL